MATRPVVPRATGEGSIGTAAKHWGDGQFDVLHLGGGDLGEYLAESTGYGIVSGCEPSISGLTVTVGAGVVHLADGTRKEISATNVTLDSADPTNPRIDLVYIDSTGTVAKVTGTASASPSAPTLPTNGISVATVTVAAGATTGTVTDSRGVLARYYNTGIVNVKDFGAKGDGVTDDTAAIQAALNIGGVIYFPAGKYRVTETLTTTKITKLKSDAVLNFFDKIYNWTSEDNISEIFFDVSSADTLLTCNATTSVEGLFINSNSAHFVTHQGQPGYDSGSKTLDQEIVENVANVNGIDFGGQSNAEIKYCKINGFSGFGVKINVCQNAINCEFNNCGRAVFSASTDNTIRNCSIHHCQNAIYADGFNLGRILACRIEWIGEYGIYINSGSDVQIINCLIDRCGYAGISTNADNDIWGLYIDSDVRRCGCCYRGVDFADITDADEYEKSSNIVLNRVSYFSVRGNNVISTAYDDGTGGNAPALGVFVGYNTFHGQVMPNWVGGAWGTNSQRIETQHAQDVSYLSDNNSLVINDKTNVNTPFIVTNNTDKTVTVNGNIINTALSGSISGNSGTVNLSTYCGLNKTVKVKVKATSYNSHGAFAEYVVCHGYNSGDIFTVTPLFTSNTNSTIINLTATINNSGVLTLSNTVTSSGGVTIFYEIGYN